MSAIAKWLILGLAAAAQRNLAPSADIKLIALDILYDKIANHLDRPVVFNYQFRLAHLLLPLDFISEVSPTQIRAHDSR